MTIDRCRMIGNIAQVRLQNLRQEGEKDKNWFVYCQLIGVLIFSFVLHTPYYFQDHNLEKLQNKTEIDSTEDHPSRVSDLWAIYQILYITTIKCLPVIIVVILNILLVKRLRVVWRRRKRILGKLPALVRFFLFQKLYF